MKKRILSVVMVLAMVLTLLPVTALAAEADPVAKIGDNTYESLSAAITAAQSGDTITLMAGVTLTNNVTVNNGKNITIDMGGHTISGAAIQLDGATLTLKNGTVSSNQAINVFGNDTDSAYSVLNIESDAKVTGTYAICLFGYQNSSSNNCYGVEINIAGKLNGIIFISGNIGNTENSASGLMNAQNPAVINVKDGAELTNSAAAIAMNGYAVVNVEDGASITGSEAVAVKRGVLNVYGGTLTATGEKVDPVEANMNGTESTGAAISVTSTYNYAGTIEVNVYSGTIKSTNNAAVYVGHSKSNNLDNAYAKGVTVNLEAGTFIGGSGVNAVYVAESITGDADTYTQKVISGGTYKSGNEKSDVSNYIPEGNTQNEDGTVIIDTDTAVAEVNGMGYATLAEAIAAASSGQTVTLLKDVTLSNRLDITTGEKITLNLNNHELTSNESFGIVVFNGSLTIKNGTFTNENGQALWIKANEGCDAEIKVEESATIEAGGYALGVDNGLGNPSVEVSGTLKGGYAGLYVNGAIPVAADISIKNTAKLSGNSGIYAAGLCDITIEADSESSKASIEGTTACGIEIRAGKLTVNGGTITGGSGKTDSEPNNNGGTTIGAGIAVAEHTTKHGVTVTINGGKITGYTALSVADPQKNENAENIHIAVNGGDFIATNEDSPAIVVEDGYDVAGFVSGGNFSHSVDKSYLDESLTAELKKSTGEAPFSYYESVEDAKKEAESGDTITNLKPEDGESGDPVMVYTVTFKVNDYKDVQTYFEGETVTIPAIDDYSDHVLEGQTFDKWVSDNEVSYEVGEEVQIDRDYTFTAEFSTDDPGTDNPGTDNPGTDNPGTDNPGTDNPGTDNPGTDNPGGGSSSGGSSSGGNIGGSSSGTTVKSGSTKNGSFTVSDRNAKAGSTVTITPKPNIGYEVDQVTVTDKNGKSVSVMQSANGTYSFTVPTATPVTVNVTFKATITAPVNPFHDVKASDYFYNAVQWAVDNDITAGTGTDTFGPNDPCTRAQIMTFLWKAAGKPVVTGTSFDDVASSAYYATPVAWAVRYGITAGTGTDTFSPNDTCTRAQAITFLWKAAGSPKVSGRSFSDVPADAYYADAVAWAVANGITSGTGTDTFGPNDTCTRAQIITFLYQVYG